MGVVDDVYNYLLNSGLAGGGSGWTLVRRRLLDSPDKCVVVQEDGGVGPEIATASGLGSAALADPAVLVTVRAEAWDGDATRTKAEAIHAALHGQRGVSLVSAGTVYLGVRAQTPEPVFAGFDGNGRPLHTISFRLLRLE